MPCVPRGRSEMAGRATEVRIRRETLRVEPAAAYRSTFAPGSRTPGAGEPLPPGWEGIYFPFDAAYDDLRPDGSPGGDDIVPDTGLPRRMYAGEDTRFLRPLRYGDLVEQRTTLGAVTRKSGRAGELVFADIERAYVVDGEVAVVSTWHDVFLPGDPTPASAGAAPAGAAPAREAPAGVAEDWDVTEQVTLDSRQLFRYSALTFNTHRVHYDSAWARAAEGLPDLLVHGPLMRMLLLDLAVRSVPGRTIAAFAMRSHAPAFVDSPITLVGRADGDGLEVRALDESGSTLARGRVGTGAAT
jgi:3-methylfumaryl-CoA hydratase